ncbi:MAG: hypothetical protein AB7D33_07195 [Sphingobium sp.]
MQDDAEWKARLQAHADRIRVSGVLGKSAQINRLFDFLVQRSLAGVATKEIEVAQEVFGLPVDANVALDATVRANVHRLRKKLEDLPPSDELEQLVLPRGEYRLILVPQAGAQEQGGNAPPAQSPFGMATPWAASLRRILLVAAALGLVVLGSIWLWFADADRSDRRIQTGFWKSLTSASFPTLLVCGDYYMFGEFDQRGVVKRLIRDPDINARGALDLDKMRGGGESKQFVDLDYHYLPEAMGPALVMVAPIVRAASNDPERLSSVGTSRFTTDMLSRNNIVYVGLLSGMGVLRDPLFEGSGFVVSADGDAIVDRATGRRFQSDWADPAEDRLLRHDYAYIASRPGPFGNRLLIISGTRDPALKEAAQIVSSRAKLDQLAQQVGNGAFEALYEVRTFGPSNYTSRPVIVRPLSAKGRTKRR